MNKKLIGTSLALVLTVASFSSVNAFGGQNGERGKRGGMEMTQEKFEEMKAFFGKYTNVADFVSARAAIKETRKAEREAMKASVTKNVENISNGVVVTITADDAAMVEKIQNKEERAPRNEAITKTVVQITNGVQMTITSDDAETVEKIQSKEVRDGTRKGGKNRMEKRGRNGQRGQGRFGAARAE